MKGIISIQFLFQKWHAEKISKKMIIIKRHTYKTNNNIFLGSICFFYINLLDH